MKFFFSQGNNRFAMRQTKEKPTLTNEELYRNALLDDLRKTKEALEVAYMGFDNVTEPDLIDCYIYELNSVIFRYNYLLEQVGKLSNREEKQSQEEKVPRAVPVIAGDKPLYSELTGNLHPETPVSAVG
ncbi:MAG: YaaL family protein [Lachnospiraceae bacterium]|nr:YaaL family protein [Lachnospiraceae bacterium]